VPVHYVWPDLYLSEQDGEGVIYVDDATREDILRIKPDAFPDPLNPNGLEVDWNQLYDYIQEIDVTVDTTMSKEDWTNEKRGDLQDAVTVSLSNANPNDPALWLKKTGLKTSSLKETAPELAPALIMLVPKPLLHQLLI
jgi:hypothetical protein